MMSTVISDMAHIHAFFRYTSLLHCHSCWFVTAIWASAAITLVVIFQCCWADTIVNGDMQDHAYNDTSKGYWRQCPTYSRAYFNEYHWFIGYVERTNLDNAVYNISNAKHTLDTGHFIIGTGEVIFESDKETSLHWHKNSNTLLVGKPPTFPTLFLQRHGVSRFGSQD